MKNIVRIVTDFASMILVTNNHVMITSVIMKAHDATFKKKKLLKNGSHPKSVPVH